MLVLIKAMKLRFLLVLLVVVAFSVTPVKAVEYGTGTDPVKPWEGLPVCNDPKPKAPVLYEPNNPVLQKAKNPGEIRLQWTKVPGASGYNVYFGLSSRNYIFSAADLGDTDNYTVKFLGNRTYYFAVQTKSGCARGPLSNEWAARPGGGGAVIVTTSAFIPVQRGTANETTVENNPQIEEQGQPQAPKLVPSAPIVPASKTAPQSGGFFQSFFSFFGRLFAR